MNIYSVIALLGAGAVFFVGIFTATDNVDGFLDGHAALIVFGGTVAVASVSYQIDRIWAMFSVFYGRVIKGKKINYVDTIKQLMSLSEAYRNGDPGIASTVENLNDHFLKECMTMLLEDYLTKEEFSRIMELRINSIFSRHDHDAKKFKALGKFPPAMGLMGAVLGMIALLQTLGKPGAESNVGPAMSVALVATLYGIAFANLVILPIAENLVEGTKETYLNNKIVLEGVKLIWEKKNKVLLAEELNSYLLPGERIDWKNV
ncbi:MAG: MotA/TolQ/ExbB proton channel family protein [Bdellovibrionales bacterium]|nr:MotA/TolQ/ExbB proton channel family protein [Bdellovibrionales bacterium]